MVVDIFGRLELLADIRKCRDFVLRHAFNYPERKRVRKQKPLKFVLLNVREHPFCAKIDSIDFLAEIFLQPINRPFSLVLKAVVIDQRVTAWKIQLKPTMSDTSFRS